MAMTEFHKNRKRPLTEATGITLIHFVGFSGWRMESASFIHSAAISR